MGYYVSQTGELKVIDDAVYDAWVDAGNPKAEAYTRIPDPPAPNAQWNGTEWVVPPAYVPQVVSRFQAKAALLQAGLLNQVETFINGPATDPLAKLAWAEAVEFYRQSPTILSMAAALSLTPQQLDELFTQAASISV